MGILKGVNLLPATGEFTYDTVAYLGQRLGEPVLTSINRYANGGPFAGAGAKTDYSIAIDNLQAAYPDCETVAIVVAWFADSTDVALCNIYPSTTYIGGTFETAAGSIDTWRCCGLTQASPGLIALPQSGDAFIYGGTPSDQSVVRCLQDLKARGLRTVFYPFILMTAPGLPWRGRIGYNGSDKTSDAAAAVAHFLGPAEPAQFARDAANLTVSYSGEATDYSLRRMILHYANLCAIAGGVDLFLLGSELRGVETIRGPGWTKAGDLDANGHVRWDYPFVDGLIALSDDVRAVFDDAGLSKDSVGLHNLISYAADWSVWMGFQHAGEDGQWPHLDQLYAHENIDLVCFDNYLPLSDWTTGTGGLDAACWSTPAPNPAFWPPQPAIMNGLGLSGQPALADIAYLKANIEGGEKFNWFYTDSDNLGIGLDPNGSALRVSRPAGDRLAQTRSPYYAGQQLLANKHIRWWWQNQHQAIYDAGDGQGWAPHGAFTQWQPQSKSITFTEYGVAAVDRGTNQPNVFYDPKSSESFTPYWSVWEPGLEGGYRPRADADIQLLYLRAIQEYWLVDGHNVQAPSGLPMIEPTFMSAWNWDARPFPTFPMRADIWGDAGNWRTGQWIGGKGPSLNAMTQAQQILPDIPVFPEAGQRGWSVHYRPCFVTAVASHVSGRECRAAGTVLPIWEIELVFDLLRSDAFEQSLQVLSGFYGTIQGEAGIFLFPAPPFMRAGPYIACRFAEDQQDLEEFMADLVSQQSLKLRSIKGEGTPSLVMTLLAQIDADCGYASEAASEADDFGAASDSDTLTIDLGLASA